MREHHQHVPLPVLEEPEQDGLLHEQVFKELEEAAPLAKEQVEPPRKLPLEEPLLEQRVQLREQRLHVRRGPLIEEMDEDREGCLPCEFVQSPENVRAVYHESGEELKQPKDLHSEIGWGVTVAPIWRNIKASPSRSRS